MRYTLHQVRQAQPKSEGFVDNIVADLVYRKLSRYVTWVLASTAVRPVAVVWSGFLVATAGAALFLTGDYGWLLVGMALIHAGNVLDCVDGELARLTGRESKYGAWLDLTLDALLELLIVGALVWAVRDREPIERLLPAGFACLVATSMMYFSIAWSSCVFREAVDENERMKRAAAGRRVLGVRLHPMLFSYSGDVRKAILTVLLIVDQPFWFLVVNAVVGNLYWAIRLWLYRRR